jgi:hypothetical protein
MSDAIAWISDDSDINGLTTNIVVIAGLRARISNLIHRGVDVEMPMYNRVTQS